MAFKNIGQKLQIFVLHATCI